MVFERLMRWLVTLFFYLFRPKITYIKSLPEAKDPTLTDDGIYNLYTPLTIVLEPGKFKVVDTGIDFEFPYYIKMFIWAKSAIAYKYNFRVCGRVMDGGCVSLILENKNLYQQITIPEGTAIAQAVFQFVLHPNLIPAPLQSSNDRCVTIEWTSYNKNDLKYLRELQDLLACRKTCFSSEYTTMLNKWVKDNSHEGTIVNPKIFKILAVDGFRGFGADDLIHYLNSIIYPSKYMDRMHAEGVRAIYEYMEEVELTTPSLTGTDSANVIFLTLLGWYAYHLEEYLLNDCVFMKVERARSSAEKCLKKHAHYYLNGVILNPTTLWNFGQIYAQKFNNDEEWKTTARYLLKKLK